MMHDIMRERLLRKLETLPEPQLYQVLDYIEFIESKYAAGRAAPADGLQRFAERLEDSMRMRSVAPKVISGTVGLMGTAKRMLRTVTDAGRDIMGEPPRRNGPRPVRPNEPIPRSEEPRRSTTE